MQAVETVIEENAHLQLTDDALYVFCDFSSRSIMDEGRTNDESKMSGPHQPDWQFHFGPLLYAYAEHYAVRRFCKKCVKRDS